MIVGFYRDYRFHRDFIALRRSAAFLRSSGNRPHKAFVSLFIRGSVGACSRPCGWQAGCLWGGESGRPDQFKKDLVCSEIGQSLSSPVWDSCLRGSAPMLICTCGIFCFFCLFSESIGGKSVGLVYLVSFLLVTVCPINGFAKKKCGLSVLRFTQDTQDWIFCLNYLVKHIYNV